MSTGAKQAGSHDAALGAQKARGRPVDAAKRDAIIRAATACFFDVGYAASSIEQIAADAGVSKVTIYNQFGDKRALFAAAVEHQCERVRGHFAIAPEAGQSIRARLTAIGEAMFAFLSRPEMVQFERRIAAETEHDPDIGRAFLEAGPWRMKAALAAFLSHAQQQGELEIPDPGLAAEQFVSMCKGIGDLERRFGFTPGEAEHTRRITGAVEVFLRAYSRKCTD